MPSPIAHSALLPWLMPAAKSTNGSSLTRAQRWLLAGAILFACLLPDFDIAVDWLILGNEPFANHGAYSHSVAAIAVAPVIWASVCRLFLPVSWTRLWLVGLIAYASHVLMDLGNAGRGLMVFWPFDNGRYLFPVRLWAGVPHSNPTNWAHHLLMLATETAFLVVMWLAARWWWGRAKTRPEPVVTQPEAS